MCVEPYVLDTAVDKPMVNNIVVIIPITVDNLKSEHKNAVFEDHGSDGKFDLYNFLLVKINKTKFY